MRNLGGKERRPNFPLFMFECFKTVVINMRRAGGSEHAGDEPAARREARGALFAVPPPVVLEKRVAPTRDESMRRVSGSPPRGLGTTADTGV